MELAQEGAKAKANEEFERYRAIRPALIEHRLQVEIELRKASKTKGAWPPPHIVMDRLLLMNTQKELSEFPPTD